MRIQPFKIAISDDRLKWVRERLSDATWPKLPAARPWECGVDAEDLRALIQHILSDYDWRATENYLNSFPQFMGDIQGQPIHFVHARCGRDDAPTVLLAHGWPSTFADFASSIDHLVSPERYGGRAEDAINIVVPSLPGYGFTPAPRTIIGPVTMARLFDSLMRDGLGIDTYIVQGGDYGSIIASWMAFRHPGVQALHLNYNGWFKPTQLPETPDEQAAIERWNGLNQHDRAYAHIASTRPFNLAYAFSDSPLGTAAWIFARFKRDIDDLWTVYDKDALATTIMIYLLTGSLPSSMLSYRGLAIEEQPPADGRITVPTGFARFPGEAANFPRSFVKKTYTNIVRWTDLSAGGHFGAFEQPKLFAEDLLAFCREFG